MKHLFIINPVAGKGKAIKLIPEIEKVFEERNEEYIIKVTQGPGHATEMVHQLISVDNYRIYSVGGDGTLNEVLNGMVNSGSSLAVIPAGSGNDFIRSISGDSKDRGLLRKMIEGREEPIDIAKVNGRYFINISSVGFDAEVVYHARRLKSFPLISGGLAYLLSTFITVFSYGSRDLKIFIDGKDFSSNSLLVAVANGRYYGGGMLPTPEASLVDGWFDICRVQSISKAKILMFFPRYIKGTHCVLKEVGFYRGKRVSISSDKEISLNIDGEIMRTAAADFELIPGGIRIVRPIGMSLNELENVDDKKVKAAGLCKGNYQR